MKYYLLSLLLGSLNMATHGMHLSKQTPSKITPYFRACLGTTWCVECSESVVPMHDCSKTPEHEKGALYAGKCPYKDCPRRFTKSEPVTERQKDIVAHIQLKHTREVRTQGPLVIVRAHPFNELVDEAIRRYYEEMDS